MKPINILAYRITRPINSILQLDELKFAPALFSAIGGIEVAQ
ncbi:hypothetical protein [Photobacterium carnosum]|nr:hypothetical protein [Photobacterium carnosum]